MKENIDRNVWTDYFNEFSRRNESRPTRLEVFGEELGAQEQEHGLLFKGITMTAGSRPSVEIMLSGRDADQAKHLTHVIAEVQAITPKVGLDGRDEALEIVSGEGNRNLLCFEQEARMPTEAHGLLFA